MLIRLKEQYTLTKPLPEGGNYREQFWHFNTDTLGVDYLINEDVAYTGTPPVNYSRPTTEEVYSFCYGTTETRYYHNGTGGVTTYEFPDSVACGYAPPADGTFIRNQCQGYDLYQIVADGNGGERLGALVEANSTSCGVTYGCTDPYALNYNAAATPGNPEENLCTYPSGVLSEVKVIEVRDCMQGVYLEWYCSRGGPVGWLFQGKTDNLYSSEVNGAFSFTDGLQAASSKTLRPSIVLNTGELNQNQYESICEVFSSPLVWFVREDGTQQKVYVEPVSEIGNRPIGTKSYSLQVKVSLPPLNALRN